jgi:hypothetical protein
MDEVLSRENLNAAYRVVKANAGAPGVDGMSVEELKEHVRKHWCEMENLGVSRLLMTFSSILRDLDHSTSVDFVRRIPLREGLERLSFQIANRSPLTAHPDLEATLGQQAGVQSSGQRIY